MKTKRKAKSLPRFFPVSDLEIGDRLLLTTWAHNAQSIKRLPLDQLLDTKQLGATVTNKTHYSDGTTGHQIQLDNLDYLYLYGNQLKVTINGMEVLEIALINPDATTTH